MKYFFKDPKIVANNDAPIFFSAPKCIAQTIMYQIRAYQFTYIYKIKISCERVPLIRGECLTMHFKSKYSQAKRTKGQ
jgi:hypothetical protein